MKVCGLTGGLGMGKSTAAGFFRDRQVPVVDTDELARELVQPSQPALAEIRSQFGNELVAADGRLLREALAQIVFDDPAARQKLEAILHPRIRERWVSQVASWRRESHRFAVVVIPLLFETRAESAFDNVICLACSPAAQRERLIARGWTPRQLEQRLAAQWPVDQKIARSDFVIWSEGALETFERQLDRVIARL